MSASTVVVDGSNLATEGRSMPSLAQLDEAVRAFITENPHAEIIVVVDASFGYRIDESERKMFEEAEVAGEIVSPPAGAVGRGDGFLLRIADRTDATVLSNDSFQEFHGEYQWLFEEGRLIGGKPVPGVGWIFTPRTPVRGPKSRVAVRDAKKASRSTAKPVREPVAEAIAEATAEAVTPHGSRSGSGRRGRRRSKEPQPEAINDPLPFITFIAEHPLGSEVEGSVETFTSHGAFITADGARCYAPVVGLGDPPPRSAKAVLKRGDVRTFVVQALDAPRRGIELALPGLARVAGAPTEETVDAEIGAGLGAPEDTDLDDEPVEQTPAGLADTDRSSASPVAVTKATARRAPARKRPGRTISGDQPPPVKEAATKKTAAKKAASKAPARKAPAKKAPPAKETSTRKAAARRAAGTRAAGSEAAGTKAVGTKTAAKKTPAGKTSAKKTPAKVPAKKTPAKAPAKKAAAKKAAAKKAVANRAVGTRENRAVPAGE